MHVSYLVLRDQILGPNLGALSKTLRFLEFFFKSRVLIFAKYFHLLPDFNPDDVLSNIFSRNPKPIWYLILIAKCLWKRTIWAQNCIRPQEYAFDFGSLKKENEATTLYAKALSLSGPGKITYCQHILSLLLNTMPSFPINNSTCCWEKFQPSARG